MAGIYVQVGDPRHWDAVLPVLDWLDGAGLRVFAHYRGLRPPARRVARLAERMGAVLPRVQWRRRPPRVEPTLTVGTVDDLLTLRALGRPFLAYPRLPLPTLLFSNDLPERIARLVPPEDDAGALFTPEAPGHLPELAARTARLRFQLTGFPQLEAPARSTPGEEIVCLCGGGLAVPHTRRIPEPSTAALRDALGPLQKAGLAVELRPTEDLRNGGDARALARLSRWVQAAAPPRPELISLAAHPDWCSLAEARAVLVASPDDLLRALAAGAERVWWLTAASGAPKRSSSALAGFALRGPAGLEKWAAARAWDKPVGAAAQLRAALTPVENGRASQRIAQATIAAVLA